MRSVYLVLAMLYTASIAMAQSYAVGSINLVPSVGNMGNAQLATGIYCPPGRLGIKPTISINYNSMQPNGDLGLGYSLAGISVISRSGSNFHLNNQKQESVTLTNSDNLSWDGERLILISGTHFVAGSVYRTEHDKFARITYTGDHFVVETKDGGKHFYGNTNDSKFKPHGASQNLSWYLAFSFDRMGNYMKYNYLNSGAEINISSIQYSGYDCTFNNTVSCGTQKENPFHSIQFHYSQIPFNEEKFVAGYAINKRRVLNKIEVFADNTKVREYGFTYDQRSTHWLLQQITEKNHLGQQLQPVQITWEEVGGYEINRTSILLSEYNHFSAVGDFDGDGSKELLVVKGEMNQYANKYIDWSTYEVYKYKNGNTPIFGSKIARGTSPGSAIAGIVVADIDADGLDDILFVDRSAFNRTSEFVNTGFSICPNYTKHYAQSITYSFHVVFMRKLPDGRIQREEKLNYFASRTFVHPEANQHLSEQLQLNQYIAVETYMSDMDGDGLPDLILRQRNGKRNATGCSGHINSTTVDIGNQNIFHIRLSSRRLLPNENDKYITATLPQSEFYISDINGNGRAELFNIIDWNNTTEAYEFDVTTNAWQQIYGAGGSAGFPTKYHKFLQMADFNGDGKTDLLYFIGNNWYIAYSTGSGFIEHNATQKWFSHNYNKDWCVSGFNLQIGDFNGDGKADIMEKHNHSHANYLDHGGDAVYIYYSTGNSFIKQHIGTNPKILDGPDWVPYNDDKNIIADWDGDGKADVYLSRYTNGFIQNRNAVEHFNFKDYKVVHVATSDKHSLIFSYNILPHTNRYTQSNSTPISLAARKINIPFTIVTEMRQKTTGYRDEITQYHFRDLMYHVHGRGIMGFLKTATVHIDTVGINRTVINTFKQNEELPYLLQPAATEVFNNSSNLSNPFSTAVAPISKSTYEYTQKQTTPGNKTLFTHLSTQEDIDYLQGVRKYTCYEYDVNGNLIHTGTQYFKNTATAPLEYMESTDNLYAQHGTWLPASLTITRTTQQRFNGQPPFQSQKEYAYNNKGLLVSNESFKNTPHYYLKEVSNYDRYGNITYTAYDTANNTTTNLFRAQTFTYTNGRFLYTKTNVLGHITTYNYDPLYGNITYTKTSTGHETFMQYDGWGRLTTTIAPDNTIETQTLAYENTLPGAYTKVTVSNNLGNAQTTYYDAKGRKIETRNSAFNGMIQAQQWWYTSRGLLAQETNVFNAQQSNTKTVNYFYYDSYNRPIRTNYNNLFNSLEITYNGLQTTETKSNGEVKTTRLDATGSVHQITDNGGTITYTYGSHGQPVSISSTTGQTITLKYNDQLQKIEMNDPNAGTTLYDYNAFGSIIAQQDAMGVTTLFTYDELGRMVKKQVGDYTYEYTYRNQNNHAANNTLTDEKCTFNGSVTHRIQYAYNNKGLLQQTIESQPEYSKTATTSYSYDSYDRLHAVAYPNIALQYEYDSYNNLVAIHKQGGSTLWKLDEVTTQGVPKIITYGNGHSNHHNYDVHGRLNNIYSYNSEAIALSMAYEFNLQTGNLTSRSYILLQKQEVFNYDNLNRLTDIFQYNTQSNTLINHTQTGYQASGNIDDIDNGLPQTLSYVTARPNALREHKFESVYSPIYMPLGSTDEHTYTFNELNRPAVLQQQALTYTITYGLDEQRIHTQLENSNNLVYETFYLNSANMEVRSSQAFSNTHTKELTYLYAGGTPFAIHEKNGEDENIYYLHLDYQGSIRAISNEQGNIVEQRDYDAWGRPRNPVTLNYTAANPFTHSLNTAIITSRGYTFHEHIFEFSLINMNARMYDPVTRRVISPDNYIQAPDNTQSFNRYSYCWNNPLKYTDPTGEIVWVIPTIGWSKQGGLSVGVSVGVGIPGGLSAQTGVGYNFKSNDAYGYVGATFALNTVSVSYSTGSGFSAGYAFGATPQSGLPVSTNALTVGVNYNVTNDSWSGNVSAWQVDQSGWTFNPSVSVMIFPERTTNFVRGQDFKTNDQVLSNFVKARNYKKALNYWGFKGTYDPDYWGLKGAPAVTNMSTGKTYYDTHAFENGFDHLYGVAYHEQVHRTQYQRDKYITLRKDYNPDIVDYEAYVQGYKQQGLYPNSNIDFSNRINAMASTANLPYSQFSMYIPPHPRAHLFYKIPRKW